MTAGTQVFIALGGIGVFLFGMACGYIMGFGEGLNRRDCIGRAPDQEPR